MGLYGDIPSFKKVTIIGAVAFSAERSKVFELHTKLTLDVPMYDIGQGKNILLNSVCSASKFN